MPMLDLLVVGGGLTGLVAALTAAEAGLSVRVIAKGMGALHWSAGSIDVLGYTWAGTPVQRPLEELGALGASHPYARIQAAEIADSLSWFTSQCALGGVPYQTSGDDGHNLWLPSPAGAKRPAYLAPSAQATGDLSQDSPIVIVGLRGMRDFYAQLIAANLTKQGIAARTESISIELITDRTDFNTVQLAKAMDQPDVRRRVGRQLAKLAKPGERLGMPAILGYTDHAGVIAELNEFTRVQVFEIPTLPPSVPGIRLHHALVHRLSLLGVRVETGMEAIGFHAQDGQIRWVETETSSRPLRHHASNFFLATGGVLGGGFTGDINGRFTETVFDLPLNAPHRRSQWFRSEFLDPDGQPIFMSGVEVDDNMQPVDAHGAIVYRNLWAAGGALAHADAIRERSLEGLAIASGRRGATALVAAFSKTQAVA